MTFLLAQNRDRGVGGAPFSTRCGGPQLRKISKFAAFDIVFIRAVLHFVTAFGAARLIQRVSSVARRRPPHSRGSGAEEKSEAASRPHGIFRGSDAWE
jgi:hypothetical protein